jgi:hypothetical protein
MELRKAESVMEVKGFMPHNNGFPMLSRDWEQLDCKSSGCANNVSGCCVVPSLAKIGEDGRCEGFTPRGTLKVERGNEV